jgi:hypothetical protein
MVSKSSIQRTLTRGNILKIMLSAVFRIWIRIRIHRIHMFLGLLDPDPLVRGMDPDPTLDLDLDPSIIKQKK